MHTATFPQVIGLPQEDSREMSPKQAEPKRSAFAQWWYGGVGQIVVALVVLILTMIGGTITIVLQESARRHEFSEGMAKVEKVIISMQTVTDGEAARNRQRSEDHKAVIDVIRLMALPLKPNVKLYQIDRVVQELERKKLSEVEQWRDAGSGSVSPP